MSLPLGEYSLKFKFIHAADVHLDGECGIATGRSVDMPTDLKSMLSDYTRRAFSRLVDLCLAEQVDFLLLAGDVFDRPDRSLSVQMFVKREMERLNSGKVDVYMCFGNHDYVNADFPKVIYPPNVHIFGSEKVENFAVIKDEEHIADVFGISFASQRGEKQSLIVVSADGGKCQGKEVQHRGSACKRGRSFGIPELLSLCSRRPRYKRYRLLGFGTWDTYTTGGY